MSRNRRGQRRDASQAARPTAPAPVPAGGGVAVRRRRRPGPLQKALLILFGLALCALGLGLLEGALALGGWGEEGLYEDPFVGFVPGRDLFAERRLPDGSRVWATQPGKLRFFNPQQFAADKAPGTYRVFALGGSTTAGRPYDHRVAFARWLELYLRDLEPERSWEVVNAGADSYASYRIVVLMRELARHEPDLFVVYTGHNEFLEERTYGEIRHRSPLATRLLVRLHGLRSATLARHAVDRLRADEPVPATLDAEVSTKLDGWTGLDQFQRDRRLEAAVAEHFAYNLHRMVALARAAGADIAFVAPASNLADFSPFKPEPTPGIDPAHSERAVELLAEGRDRLAAGAAAESCELLREAAALDPERADVQFHLGRCLLALGDRAGARTAFVRAKDFDAAPLRATEPLVASVRAVARQYDLPIVDLPALLDEESARRGRGIPGDDLFLDHVHPDVPVHARIAAELVDLLAARGVARRPDAEARRRWQDITRREVAALDERYYGERDLKLAKVLGWAGKLAEAEPALRRAAAVIPDDPEVPLNLGIVCQRTGRFEEALVHLQRAVELAPGSAQARFNLGVVLGELGRLDEGIAALESALALEPDLVEAQHNLGVLRGRQGDTGAAEARFQAVLAERPDAPEPLLQLARLRRQEERWAEAAELARRAVAAEPGSGAAHEALGLAAAQLGRRDEARQALERAVGLEPALADAHYQLGLLLAAEGRPEAAEAAYRRAAAADPTHAPALNNLAILVAARGEGEAAREALERAVAAAPEFAEAHLNLAVVHDAAGRPDAALASARRAVDLSPDEPRARAALGMLLLARGEAEEAREHLRRAAEGGAALPPEAAAAAGLGSSGG